MKRAVLLFATLWMLAGCGGVKVSKSLLEMMLKRTNTVSTAATYADSCDRRVGVSYVENGDPNQVLDIYYAHPGIRKNAVPIRPKVFTPCGTLINCPAYDFETFGEAGSFSKSALLWFIGPRYQDKKWMASMSPRTYLETFEGPLLVSTCTRDFIRGQSILIKADCDKLGRQLEFVDIASDDRRVGHVHNVSAPTLPESQEINARMVAFMDRLLP